MRVIKKNFEVRFTCTCGCEFLADDTDYTIEQRQATAVDMILLGNNKIKTVSEYVVGCPECDEIVRLPKVP